MALCAAKAPVDRAETIERNRHGRQEHRRVETFDVAGRLGPEWDGLIVAVARVTRLTWHKDTKSGFWHDTHEISLYACQINLPADVMAKVQDALKQPPAAKPTAAPTAKPTPNK